MRIQYIFKILLQKCISNIIQKLIFIFAFKNIKYLPTKKNTYKIFNL